MCNKNCEVTAKKAT